MKQVSEETAGWTVALERRKSASSFDFVGKETRRVVRASFLGRGVKLRKCVSDSLRFLEGEDQAPRRAGWAEEQGSGEVLGDGEP